MALLISVPLLGGLAIIQSAILSDVPLLLGTSDLVLVVLLAWALQDEVKNAWQWSLVGGGMMTLLSGLPFGVYLATYLGATFIARYIRRRVWKLPFLGMLTATLIGTLLIQLTSWLARWMTGVLIPIETALTLIVLPSLLLNLLVTVPIFYVIKDLAQRLYPKEIEV
jgi:rod shape-determining protein MreD